MRVLPAHCRRFTSGRPLNGTPSRTEGHGEAAEPARLSRAVPGVVEIDQGAFERQPG